jgi:hypothetical protein
MADPSKGPPGRRPDLPEPDLPESERALGQGEIQRCPECEGSGKDKDGKPCQRCSGTGEIYPAAG